MVVTMRSQQRKPPLPKSPTASHNNNRRLLTPLRLLRSSHLITTAPPPPPPPASLVRTPLAIRSSNVEELELRPEYQTISCEMKALAKMVQHEFGKPELGSTKSGSLSNVIFERGRFYDEYAAKRNERLKRKRGQTEVERENLTSTDFGVGVQSAQRMVPKRREVAKRAVVSTPMRENRVENSRREGLKKEVVSTPMSENRAAGSSRYMLRSMNKENNKPPLPMKYEGSTAGKLVVTRRTRKI